MADPWFREIGTVEDIDGRRLVVAIDYDTVTIGDYRFDRDRLNQLLVLQLTAAQQAAGNKPDPS